MTAVETRIEERLENDALRGALAEARGAWRGLDPLADGEAQAELMVGLAAQRARAAALREGLAELQPVLARLVSVAARGGELPAELVLRLREVNIRLHEAACLARHGVGRAIVADATLACATEAAAELRAVCAEARELGQRTSVLLRAA